MFSTVAGYLQNVDILSPYGGGFVLGLTLVSLLVAWLLALVVGLAYRLIKRGRMANFFWVFSGFWLAISLLALLGNLRFAVN